jgi:signal transduction histidine kinase
MSGVLLVLLGFALGAVSALVFAASRWRRPGQESRQRLALLSDEADARERTLTDDLRALTLILGSMEDGVLLVDRDGRRVYANPALERLLGPSPAHVRAPLPSELQHAVLRAVSTGLPFSVDIAAGTAGRWLRSAATPAGEDGSVLLVIRDVTEVRRLDAVRRDFVANASHELKTPIASIRAAAETLRDGAIGDPPAAIRFTEQLEKEAQRLSRIVSDLLDLSRLESGSELEERVRIDAVAGDEVERLEDRAAAASVSLSLRSDGVPTVMGSGRDLALLARNLVDNAIRYTAEGGSVIVSVTTDETDVVLRVQDTGMGIPTRDLPRIFERFYRVDRARSRETGGTGLGLAIVKHVAENHGGSVSVQSELGSGSTFEVRLPAVELP